MILKHKEKVPLIQYKNKMNLINNKIMVNIILKYFNYKKEFIIETRLDL